jgi:hypothetical protein
MRIGHVLFDGHQTLVVRLAPAAIVVRANEDHADVELAFFDVGDLEATLGGRRGGLGRGRVFSGRLGGRRLGGRRGRGGGTAGRGDQCEKHQPTGQVHHFLFLHLNSS